jgi:hypothetical protein
MTITNEIKKLLTEEVLGECWLWDEDLDDEGMCKKCGQCFESHRLNRTFDTDADMMALFRKIVDNLKFGAFQNFAYKHFNVYPNYTLTEWLFYEPERFCNLVAEWLEERGEWEHDFMDFVAGSQKGNYHQCIAWLFNADNFFKTFVEWRRTK